MSKHIHIHVASTVASVLTKTYGKLRSSKVSELKRKVNAFSIYIGLCLDR